MVLISLLRGVTKKHPAPACSVASVPGADNATASSPQVPVFPRPPCRWKRWHSRSHQPLQVGCGSSLYPVPWGILSSVCCSCDPALHLQSAEGVQQGREALLPMNAGPVGSELWATHLAASLRSLLASNALLFTFRTTPSLTSWRQGRKSSFDTTEVPSCSNCCSFAKTCIQKVTGVAVLFCFFLFLLLGTKSRIKQMLTDPE